MLNKNKEWMLAGMILLVTFLVFSPVFDNGFVNWDDDINVTQNQDIKELNAAGIKNIFTHTIIGGYTPLTTLSFAVENRIFGMKPGVFHFNNLMLHLLCTLLVFIFLRKLGATLFVSFVAAMLFGIHPMRVESVAWVTERKDLLYGFFYLLTLIFYIAFYRRGKTVFYFLALLTFIFALLSKIQAVSLPLILLLIDYFFGEKFRVKQLLNKIPFFVLSLITGIAGFYFLGKEGSLETNTILPFFQRIFIGTYSFVVYIIKSVVPFELSAIYPYPARLTLLFYASALLIILMALLVYKSGKHRKVLVFGSLFFFFNVIFVLQIVGAGQAFLADRFTYIAYIGLFFMIAWALDFFFISKWKWYVIVTGVVYLAALGTVTFNRTRVWKNSGTLFSDVITKYPNVAIAHNNLGLYYRDQHQNSQAIESYSKSIGINPGAYTSYSNRGEVYFELGESGKALDDMNMALKINPDYGKALTNRGAIRGSRKEFALAIKDLDKAITLENNNLDAYSNRLLAYYSMGNYEKASQDATSYLNINPENANVLNQRGLCFDHLNRNQEAAADFNKAILINPAKGSYFQNRSYLLAKMGDYKGALRDILQAQQLGIKVNQAYLQMLQAR